MMNGSVEAHAGTERVEEESFRYLRRILRILKLILLFLILYLILAYLVLPALWRHYEHHPAMADIPKTSFTKEGFPGDPLNAALVGTREEIDSGPPGREVVSRRSHHVSLGNGDRQGRPPQSSLSHRAHEQFVPVEPPPGPGLRAAGRKKPPPPPSRPVLVRQGPGPRRPAALARGRHLRPRHRDQPSDGPGHASHRPRYRRRTR